MDVADKVAVVAGGGSGMGKATAELLSEQGARVAILDLPTSKGPVTAKEIGATFHPCDVTDEPATEQALAAAMEAHGALHIAINTAGGGYSKRTINKDGPLPLADFRALIELNLIATFNLNRLQAWHMSSNEPDAEGERGVIVNTSSIAAFEGQIGQVAYSAAKAGIAGMSLTMARDLGSLGIRVMAIAPSLFATGLLEGAPEDVVATLTKDAAFPRPPPRVRLAGRRHHPEPHAQRPDHPPGRRPALRPPLTGCRQGSQGGPMTQPKVSQDVLTERLAKIPPIVDMDSHVVEPAHVWSDRLPAPLRDTGPRIEYAPRGQVRLVDGKYVETPGTEGPEAAWWVYEDTRTQIKRYIASAGVPAGEVTNEGITYEDMRRGCWIPAQRLADMDVNGVQAQLCFPNYPRFCGQIFLWAKDKDLARLCVEAYNDWMVEEWSGPSKGRLIPLCLVPLWDVDLAINELRRNAARGVRAVAFSELPAYLDLPSLHSRYWDPFFATCEETGTVLAMHIGSGTRTPQTSADAPGAVGGTIIFGNSVASMTDFMFSGVLHRFPGLRLLYAEAQIGWIPYLLERIDDVWETHRGWSRSQENCPEPPSTYYYRQITSCFFKDAVGVGLLEQVGLANVTFETDYPHQDGTWPRSREEAALQFGHLAQDVITKIARGNAIKLLGLDLPER